MAARERAHPPGVHYHRSRCAKCSSSSAPSSPGERRPEKVGVKTGQGSAGAAGGFKAVEVKEKKEADCARFPVPLAFASSEMKQESRGFAEFGLPGAPDLMRAQRVASALNPLCAEGDGLRGRWSGTRVGWKGCTSRR